MDINVGPGIDIDAQLVVTGRGCVIGQSGSGKSYLVGVVIEELCALGLPFVVIDTEGEYSSLKSKFNVIWVGEENGADIGTKIDYAELFSKSMDNSIPVVLDVSDVMDRADLVYRALKSLYAVGEKKRKPYLVIIEEADKFAPQIVHPEANIVEEISVRGRKRGIGLLVATQRPANVSKNVLAQCSYGFVGKLSIENDIKAVTILFEDKKRLFNIPNLKTGSFMPFGLGHNDEIRVKKRRVVHGGSTPSLSQSLPSLDADRMEKVIKDVRSGVTISNKTTTKIGGEVQASGAPARHANQVRMSYVMEQGFTENDARDYATRETKKQFGIFGKSVEQVDSIKLVYSTSVLCSLRLPTRRPNEYNEISVLLKGTSMVTLGKKIDLHSTGLTGPVKMNEKEKAVLKSLYIRNKSDPRGIEKDTGIPDIDVEKTLSRFRRIGLVTEDRGTVTFNNYKRYALHSQPNVSKKPIMTDETQKTEARMLSDAEGMVSTLFPGSTLLSTTVVYLPIYRISLRKGGRVRIFNIEAVYGNRIELPELERVD